MGFTTFDEFKEDLSVATEQRGNSDRWYGRRVNRAYFDIASTILHEQMRHSATVRMVKGQERYCVEGAIGIVSVADDKGNKVIPYIENENMEYYSRQPRAVCRRDSPDLWTVQGDTIRVWPTPDREWTFRVTYYRNPAPMLTNNSTTILDQRWDQAIHFIGCHFAWMDLKDTETAHEFLAKARNYVDNRLVDADIRQSQVMPTPVPENIQDFIRRRSSL